MPSWSLPARMQIKTFVQSVDPSLHAMALHSQNMVMADSLGWHCRGATTHRIDLHLHRARFLEVLTTQDLHRRGHNNRATTHYTVVATRPSPRRMDIVASQNRSCWPPCYCPGPRGFLRCIPLDPPLPVHAGHHWSSPPLPLCR